MIPLEIQTQLNALAEKYKPIFLSEVKKTLSQKKFRASGHLQDSLKVVIIPATDTETPKIIIAYEDYGDFIDAKKHIYTKLPPIDAEWVGLKSLRNRRIPGYKTNSNINISIEDQNKRIAFAIARDKRINNKHRRKRWKREALPPTLETMNIDLVNTWATETANILAKALTTKK